MNNRDKRAALYREISELQELYGVTTQRTPRDARRTVLRGYVVQGKKADAARAHLARQGWACDAIDAHAFVVLSERAQAA